MATPLTSLLQKNGFKWGDLEDKAFNELKNKLTQAPILALPNFEETFVVEADASATGIGAVLLQKGQPLGYFSCKLGPRMRVAAYVTRTRLSGRHTRVGTTRHGSGYEIRSGHATLGLGTATSSFFRPCRSDL